MHTVTRSNVHSRIELHSCLLEGVEEAWGEELSLGGEVVQKLTDLWRQVMELGLRECVYDCRHSNLQYNTVQYSIV